MEPFWRCKVADNIEGITSFVDRLVCHPGTINPKYLYQVTKTANGFAVRHSASCAGDCLRQSIRIPGEITNSFCTLYEVGYFVNALFLSGVASSLPLDAYALDDDPLQRSRRIREDVKALGEREIEAGLHAPRIPIVSWLTDDVETYRFRKEMLWGIGPDASRRLIGQISRSEMGVNESDELRGVLWTEQDSEIAKMAIGASDNLPQAKMLQYYIAIDRFLSFVGISLTRIPFFFFSSPYHELLDLGPDHGFIQLLSDVHSQQPVRVFSELTRQDSPVFIKTSCPVCGESSKKVLQGRLKGADRRTVRLVCAKGEKTFRNEHNRGTLARHGCGHSWEFNVPSTGRELYAFLRENPFSLHIALANLLQLYTDSAMSPVAHVICDLNIRYNSSRQIEVFAPYPRGYGSSAELFTSVMGIQLAFLCDLLGGTEGSRGNIVDRPFMIIAHQSPSKLFDPRDVYEDIRRQTGIIVGPQDSSIWRVLDGGLSPEEVVSKSIDLTYYSALRMLKDIRRLDVKEPALFQRFMATSG